MKTNALTVIVFVTKGVSEDDMTDLQDRVCNYIGKRHVLNPSNKDDDAYGSNFAIANCTLTLEEKEAISKMVEETTNGVCCTIFIDTTEDVWEKSAHENFDAVSIQTINIKPKQTTN